MREITALTPRAHRSLWHALLGIDLVATIETTALPFDDPLPELLTDPRMITTTAVADEVWVRPVDIPRLLAARTYGTTDGFTLAVDDRRFRLDGGPGGATCRPVRTRPDLELDGATLGSLLMGGRRLGPLAAVGRVAARSDEIVRRVDRFFLGDVEPHAQTRF